MRQRPADRQRVGDIQWQDHRAGCLPSSICAGERIWCYVSMGKEVCTEQILVSAWRAGKRTAVPKVTGKREMKFYYIESLNDLETGAFGILEPKEEKKGADCCLEKSDLLMLVPGVFVRSGGKKDRIWRRILRHVSSENGRMPYVWTCVWGADGRSDSCWGTWHSDGICDDRKEVLEMLTGLPKDPILLLSVVNTKLRDYYPSLDALCDDMDVSREVLEEKLGMIDYRYDAEKNQFE